MRVNTTEACRGDPAAGFFVAPTTNPQSAAEKVKMIESRSVGIHSRVWLCRCLTKWGVLPVPSTGEHIKSHRKKKRPGGVYRALGEPTHGGTGR